MYFSNLSSHKNTTLQDWVHFLIKSAIKLSARLFPESCNMSLSSS